MESDEKTHYTLPRSSNSTFVNSSVAIVFFSLIGSSTDESFGKVNSSLPLSINVTASLNPSVNFSKSSLYKKILCFS